MHLLIKLALVLSVFALLFSLGALKKQKGLFLMIVGIWFSLVSLNVFRGNESAFFYSVILGPALACTGLTTFLLGLRQYLRCPPVNRKGKNGIRRESTKQ